MEWCFPHPSKSSEDNERGGNGAFIDEDGQPLTSCAPKVLGPVSVAARKRDHNTTLDKAVAAAVTDTPESAVSIRKKVRRKDSDVRGALDRLALAGRANDTGKGWVKGKAA